MERNSGSLIGLTVACTISAVIFGFGAEMFSWRSAYEGLGREALIQTTRLVVYVTLGILLAFRGGWHGVLAAIAMAFVATSVEWALYPFSYAWASIEDPAGYAETFGGVQRPDYAFWTTYDIIGVGISAALAQGLRTMAHVNPRDL